MKKYKNGEHCPSCGRFKIRELQTSAICLACGWSISYPTKEDGNIKDYLNDK
jgi:RNase P subunit RPR2